MKLSPVLSRKSSPVLSKKSVDSEGVGSAERVSMDGRRFAEVGMPFFAKCSPSSSLCDKEDQDELGLSRRKSWDFQDPSVQMELAAKGVQSAARLLLPSASSSWVSVASSGLVARSTLPSLRHRSQSEAKLPQTAACGVRPSTSPAESSPTMDRIRGRSCGAAGPESKEVAPAGVVAFAGFSPPPELQQKARKSPARLRRPLQACAPQFSPQPLSEMQQSSLEKKEQENIPQTQNKDEENLCLCPVQPNNLASLGFTPPPRPPGRIDPATAQMHASGAFFEWANALADEVATERAISTDAAVGVKVPAPPPVEPLFAECNPPPGSPPRRIEAPYAALLER